MRAPAGTLTLAMLLCVIPLSCANVNELCWKPREVGRGGAMWPLAWEEEENEKGARVCVERGEEMKRRKEKKKRGKRRRGRNS